MFVGEREREREGEAQGLVDGVTHHAHDVCYIREPYADFLAVLKSQVVKVEESAQ